MIVQTQSVTGKTQEKQTESRDDISDNKILRISHKNQAITKSHKTQAKEQPIKSHNEETKYLVLCSCL